MKRVKSKTKIYTLKELEEILQVDERTLFRYLKKGTLCGSKIGKWRFTEADIRAFLDAGRKQKKI